MEFVKKCKRVLRNKEQKNSGVAPQGCVCVYVGPDKERFVIKIKKINHPLFKVLLDAAEREYGYRNDGPLWLPCDVDLFCETLTEMEGTLTFVDTSRDSCQLRFSMATITCMQKQRK